MKLTFFKQIDFLPAIKALFTELKVPMNYVADEPTTAKEILKDTYKDNTTFQLIDDVYFVGMVDDAAFEGNKSLEVSKIKSDYDGVLIFGITLHKRKNNLLPTRSQLAEISRAFNREFYYTPVVLVFKYQDDTIDYLAFANTERLKYKQEWREGEKAGKVSLLRDINIKQPHRGHEDIINQLKIPTVGTKSVDSFDKLYKYWQEVFSVSLLNKKFYQELSNWYFWAVKHVTFPNKPTLEIAHQKGVKLEDLVQEHNATNVIRLLTRLLFTWFIKEKKLIPEQLFDLGSLQEDILNKISPYHEEGTIFAQANKDSVYYRAILQNLFFASLNCPIKADGIDNRKRGFRGDGYGTHRGIDYLMRYKEYFKNPEAFLEMMNETVPFLNGGLFECLDDKYKDFYIDGFSDQMTKGEQLVVPDYLFFGVEEHVDLSNEYGISNSGTKQAAVKGLINILKSYKFTITENTPIEEDVALEPELLGKVFENLLASYNPETKTTARKQTGSFYTPREIVSYMVDESLIGYLKNKILEDATIYSELGTTQTGLFGNQGKIGQLTLQSKVGGSEFENKEEQLDVLLHDLVSYDPGNPFKDYPKTTSKIIKHLDECKILDPACGSGAFPMGVLQKMVHILQKLDPKNKIWKEVQLNKALDETEEAYAIEDRKEREEKLIEINNAFDENVNDPDYARKLYLIENCIYGVDIQPIATQISKLRFFISLVVDQKKNKDIENFGVHPLPNLETKFVTADTLIGIEKPKAQTSLFDTASIKKLEADLKKVRHKVFSARTKDTKLKYRVKDEELRNKIAGELKKSGWQNETAEKLASWDPYDQNATSSFFDKEWMFDIKGGFDVVIGNPPYVSFKSIDKKEKKSYSKFTSATGKYDLYVLFIEKGIEFLIENGILSFINPNKFINSGYGEGIKKIFLKYSLDSIVDFNDLQVFEGATNYTCLLTVSNRNGKNFKYISAKNQTPPEFGSDSLSINYKELGFSNWSLGNVEQQEILRLITQNTEQLGYHSKEVTQGLRTGHLKSFFNLINKDRILIDKIEDDNISKVFTGKNVKKFNESIDSENDLILYPYEKSTFDPINIEEYPYTKLYLEQFQNELANRKDSGKVFKNTRKKWFEYWDNKKLVFSSPKIVFPDISNTNNFYLDEVGIPYLNTCYSVFLKKQENYRPIYAILNSKVTEYYIKAVSPFVRGGFYRYKSSYVKSIPVSNKFYNSKNILSLLTHLCEHSLSQFEQILNAVVFNLYFSDHMKEKEIDVLQFVEKDIELAIQGRDFETLSNTEKESVIEQLHQTWSHPDNEVRNRIKLFAVRSPDILKPILES